jgi:threonine synthase
VLSVSESEIIIALEKSLKKGWMIEPTSATALAGFSQLKEDLITLIIVSGSGLKINQQLAEFVPKQ